MKEPTKRSLPEDIVELCEHPLRFMVLGTLMYLAYLWLKS